jgi:transcriptional regulator with XRE-family HTH domain
MTMSVVGFAMTELAAYLQEEMERRNLKEQAFADEVGVSRTQLRNTLSGGEPKLSTLRKYAEKLNLPLWRIIQMAGFDLNLPNAPSDQAVRLAGLAQQDSQIARALPILLALQAKDLGAALDQLEGLVLLRGRQQQED